MSNNQKRIDQLKLEMQVAVDEYNKIHQKIQELNVAKQSLKMKAFSCEERIKELQGLDKVTIQTEIVN
tara:strand:+ start:750 stop:953 length:204 start_codon:yes stop_codon:yes gene_type:complete